MKSRMITTAAVVGLLAALAAGDVFAARRGNGGSNGQRNVTATATRTSTATSVRAQRHDGTFLTTGTTANGSTTRQGKGNGLMDGSGLAATTATTTVTTTAP